MTSAFATPAALTITVFGIVAMIALGMRVYWFFNKQAKLRDLSELRQRFSELEPNDPQYNAVRALYTSMSMDAERWSFSHSESGSSVDGGGGDGGGDSGGGGDGGGGD